MAEDWSDTLPWRDSPTPGSFTRGWLRGGCLPRRAVSSDPSVTRARPQRPWGPCLRCTSSSSPVFWQCLDNSAQRSLGCRPSACATVGCRLYTERTWRRDLLWSRWPPQPVSSKMAIRGRLWNQERGERYPHIATYRSGDFFLCDSCKRPCLPAKFCR